MHRLYDWSSSENFSEILSQKVPTDPTDFFSRPENQIFRDAILARMFAEKSGAAAIKMIEDKYSSVDFQIELRGSVLNIQSTEAGLPGRRIAQEYKQLKAAGYPIREDPEEKIQERRAAIPGALQTAVRKKCAINYSDAQNICLLIYLNLGTYDLDREEIEQELIQYTEEARQHFRSVWVLWSSRLYRCWPNPFIQKAWYRPKRFECERVAMYHDFREAFSLLEKPSSRT